MTTRIALVLLATIAAFFAADQVFFGGEAPVFLGRKFIAFIDWIAFWR